MNKPMIDIAYEVLTKKKKAMTFLKIWEETSQVADLNEQQKEDNIAQFYTDVSLDDRFVHVGNNEWDLRSRHTYKEVVIDTSDLLIEEAEDEEETFDTEDTEEKGRGVQLNSICCFFVLSFRLFIREASFLTAFNNYRKRFVYVFSNLYF